MEDFVYPIISKFVYLVVINTFYLDLATLKQNFIKINKAYFEKIGNLTFGLSYTHGLLFPKFFTLGCWDTYGVIVNCEENIVCL